MPERQPQNLTYELAQRLAQGVDELSVNAKITAIRPVDKNGKKYTTVEFVDTATGESKRINVFNRKQLEGIEEGSDANLNLTRNEKGYWNLASINLPGMPSEAAVGPENAPQSSKAPVYSPRLESKDYAMQSMNALNNASVLVAAMINARLLEPKNPTEAMTFVQLFHGAMMQLHEPPTPNGNRTGI